MYKAYPSGNVYIDYGNGIRNFVGNWIAQGYQSLEVFLRENRDCFI